MISNGTYLSAQDPIGKKIVISDAFDLKSVFDEKWINVPNVWKILGPREIIMNQGISLKSVYH